MKQLLFMVMLVLAHLVVMTYMACGDPPNGVSGE